VSNHNQEIEIVANALHKCWSVEGRTDYSLGEIFYAVCRYSPWAKKLFIGENYGVLKNVVDEMLQSQNKLTKMIEQNGSYRLEIYI
jgi:hypothetical protein